jgi:hypothetical protein
VSPSLVEEGTCEDNYERARLAFGVPAKVEVRVGGVVLVVGLCASEPQGVLFVFRCGVAA